MSTLEQRLHELGRELAFPPEPDLAPRVLARTRGRPFPWRAAALAFAVPPARSAILRFLHLGGATVELVDTLPPAAERARAGGLGRPLPPAEAERRVGFDLLLPPLDPDPERAYVIGDSVATVVLRSHGEDALKKLAVDKTVIEPTRVNGAPGLWLEGGPHALTWIDRETGYHERPVLVRGNVLLWLHGGLTLRLEGRLSKAQALEIARSIR